MKIHVKSLLPALKNSAVTAVLVIAVLGLFGDLIPGQTPVISLGYGLMTFLAVLPASYLSFLHRWNDGAILSVKRLYTPLLTLAFSLLAAFIYTPLVYGNNPIDFFVTSEGSFNAIAVWTLVKYAIIAVAMVSVIQWLGASNEREIIVNKKPASSPPNQVIRLQGGTKSNVIDLDINRFLYAESDANYLRIRMLGEGRETLLLRMTIKQFVEELAAFPEIVQCHRAFVVNTRNVSYCETGSGRGTAHFQGIEDTVPLSRTYSDAFLSRMQQD